MSRIERLIPRLSKAGWTRPRSASPKGRAERDGRGRGGLFKKIFVEQTTPALRATPPDSGGEYLAPAIMLVLVFLIIAVDASAQSVADVARQERERRKNTRSTVVVVAGQTATTSAGTAATVPATPPPAAKPFELTDNKGHNEKYWREQFQKARDDVKRSEDRVQLADLKLKDLNTQLLTRSDIYDRENRLAPLIAQAQKDLDEANKQSEAAKQKLSDLEDELRKSGGPAGWSR